MEKEFNNLQMEIIMKENILMDYLKVMDNIFGMMEVIMLET